MMMQRTMHHRDEKRQAIKEILKNKLGITHINSIPLGRRLEFDND